MAFFIDWTEKLLPVRTSLAASTMINDPENFSKKTGTIDFLLNPALNPRNIEAIQVASSNSGKYRAVEIRFRAHQGTEDLVTTDASVVCTKNDQIRETIVTEEPDLFASYKFTLEWNYMRQNNEEGVNVQSRIQQGIQTGTRIMRESISSQCLSKLNTAMGTNPANGAGAGTFTNLELIASAGGASVPNFDVIINEQEENFMGGPIAIINQGGTSQAKRYFNRLATGNVNTSVGVDIQAVAAQFGMINFADQSTTTNLGTADRVLAIYPGLHQMYGYNLYASGEVLEVPGDTFYTTIDDPIHPIRYDMKMTWDNNCSTGNGLQGAWIITLFKYFDVFSTPTDAFGGSYADLAGFNGIIGYNITTG